MVVRGLERAGMRDLAREIALEHLARVADAFRATGTLWENYAPEGAAPGKPAKPDFVGWTGIVPILFFLEYAIGLRPDAPGERLSWNLAAAKRCGCERYRFGGRTLSILAEPAGPPPAAATITVETDGAFRLDVERGGRRWEFAVRPGKHEFRLE